MPQWYTASFVFLANVPAKVTSCLEYMIHKVNAHFTMLKARPNPEAFSVNIWSTNFMKQRISCKLVQCLRLSVNIEEHGMVTSYTH